MTMGPLPGTLSLLLALQVALAVGPGGRDQPTNQTQEATAHSSSAVINALSAPAAMATLTAALARATTPEAGGHILEALSKPAVTPGNDGGYDVPTDNGVAYEIATPGNHGWREGTDLPGNTTGAGGVLAVGDARYKWLAWSKWHCNCETGSMSRVRDITYTEPGLQLDPGDYNALRFQRVACSYTHCKCSHQHRECDHTTVTCDDPNHYLCALRDVRRARYLQARLFWIQVRAELKGLWNSIRKAVYQVKEENKENS